MFSAPQPRSRLYTTLKGYRLGLLDIALGGSDRSERIAVMERAVAALHPGYAAIGVPMARVGIYLALKQLIQPGQKVIMSPYTIADVVNMVLCAGGVPLFADTESNGSCNIDAAAVERLLDEETDVGAVLVTHFYGLICDMPRIRAACEARKIPVAEDAAQAFGASTPMGRAGALSDVGIFSFGLLKNITSFIGGVVLTRDAALERRIRHELEGLPVLPPRRLVAKMARGAAFDLATSDSLFDTFVYWTFRAAYLNGVEFFKNQLDTDANPVSYSVFPERYAFQMAGIQADLIRTQLSRCQGDTAQRIANAQRYHEGLKHLPDVTLPPLRLDGSHNYLYYPIQARNRDDLARFMTMRFRDIQLSHHRNCASLPCFAAFARECPNAARAGRDVIYLPTYPGYRKDQVAANVEAIREYFGDGNSCG